MQRLADLRRVSLLPVAMLEGERNNGRYPLRKVALFLSLFVLPLAFAATAVAAPPESETILIDETVTDTELCGFPIVIHSEGRIKITTHFDQAGNLVFESATPSIRVTVTNPETGKTLRDADVGLDKFTPTPDGGGVVLSTGIHFRILPEHGAPIFTRIGLQIVIVNADGSFEVQEIGGNFDPAENFPGVACDYLADP
jgi:hypothetical protein